MNRTQIFLALAGVLLVGALWLANERSLPREDHHRPPDASTHGQVSLDLRTTHPWVTARRTEAFVTVELTGGHAAIQRRAPLQLALIIDRSGSMHGAALEHAKEAALHLISRLEPHDQLTVVHYGSDVEVLALSPMAPLGKEAARAFVRGIHDDGGTNVGGGLEAAWRELSRPGDDVRILRRAILLTDGRPTEGQVEDAALLQLARAMRASGITLSTLGLGDDFNEDLLASLADVGAGTYGYLQHARGIASLFARDLELATRTVAQRVELVLTPANGVTLERVLGARGTHDGAQLRIPLPDLAAGQVERVVAAVTFGGGIERVGSHALSAELRWTDPETGAPRVRAASLELKHTEDSDLALARRDPIAGALTAHALAAEQSQLAARALEQGDAAAVEAHIATNRELVRDVAEGRGAFTVGAPEHLAQLDRDVREQEALLEAAPEARAGALKQLKRHAQKGLGRVGSTL